MWNKLHVCPGEAKEVEFLSPSNFDPRWSSLDGQLSRFVSPLMLPLQAGTFCIRFERLDSAWPTTQSHLKGNFLAAILHKWSATLESTTLFWRWKKESWCWMKPFWGRRRRYFLKQDMGNWRKRVQYLDDGLGGSVEFVRRLKEEG